MKKSIAALTVAVFVLSTVPAWAGNLKPQNENGVNIIMGMVLVGAGSTQMLFENSGASNRFGSSFLSFGSLATGYSQLPGVKRDHREKLAREIGINPTGLSDKELYNAVRDDDINAVQFYRNRWEESLNIPKPTNGGGLRARILQAQK